MWLQYQLHAALFLRRVLDINPFDMRNASDRRAPRSSSASNSAENGP